MLLNFFKKLDKLAKVCGEFVYETKFALVIKGNSNLNFKEILECFGFSPDTLTSSAFVQQRTKIKPEAFNQQL